PPCRSTRLSTRRTCRTRPSSSAAPRCADLSPSSRGSMRCLRPTWTSTKTRACTCRSTMPACRIRTRCSTIRTSKRIGLFGPQRDMLLVWERALGSTADGIMITDPRQPDNPIVYCNPAFERMSGYGKAEAIGRNPRFLQGQERDQEAVAELRRAIAESRACRVTIRNYRKNGELFWNDVSLAPVLDTEGRVIHYIGVQHDITEQ